VIVFDFVREAIAGQIFDGMVSAVFRDMREHRGIDISLAKQAETPLRQACLADLSNGGRGIRNKVEALLINPLARALFEVDGGSGDRFEISALDTGQVNAVRLDKR
jgi:ATP-dependent Clp protease ATP-binding subunit ClpA